MMNDCCKKHLQALNNKFADYAELFLKMSGERKTIMEEASYRRAEFYAEAMDLIKTYAMEHINDE